ncbi:MAG: OadG family protein [Phycisphaeraceae bacterium]
MSVLMLASTGGVQTGLLLMVVGMGVVFGSLLMLMTVVALMQRVLAEAPAVVVTPPREPTPVVAASSGGGVDGALVAVLTAAATAALGRQARIHGVRLVARRDRAWAQQGRRSIMTSHRPQRRRGE